MLPQRHSIYSTWSLGSDYAGVLVDTILTQRSLDLGNLSELSAVVLAMLAANSGLASLAVIKIKLRGQLTKILLDKVPGPYGIDDSCYHFF